MWIFVFFFFNDIHLHPQFQPPLSSPSTTTTSSTLHHLSHPPSSPSTTITPATTTNTSDDTSTTNIKSTYFWNSIHLSNMSEKSRSDFEPYVRSKNTRTWIELFIKFYTIDSLIKLAKSGVVNIAGKWLRVLNYVTINLCLDLFSLWKSGSRH